MNEVYRGHEIVRIEGQPHCLVIIEQSSGAPLPTKVTILPDEGEWACRRRARQLIDIYLEVDTAH